MHSPTARWLREDLRDEARALLLGERLTSRGLFDRGEIVRMLGEHETGERDGSFVIMMLMAIEVWHRVFIDPPDVCKPDFTLADCARN
jgi:asparagine synthase (glutamine-hydrolysing)